MPTQYPPGPKGAFLIGNLRELATQRLEFLTEVSRRYGDLVFFRAGPRGFYLLNHPDFVHQVLVKNADKFHKSPILKKTTEKAIGQGLLTSDGAFHKRQRRLVQPAFHAKRIEAYAGVMVDYTVHMLDTWRDGAALDIAHEMMALTMKIVAKTLFDADMTETDEVGQAISVGIETVSQRMTQPLYLPDWVPTPANRRRLRALKVLDDTVNGIINARRSAPHDKGDLLSMLLLSTDEDGGQMNDKQVRDEAMTLFIAGHETTANALTWAFYLLSQNPEAEAKLNAEASAILADRVPTLSDLPRLPYHEMVIREAMRLYPPAWITSREAIAEVEIGGYTIKQGGIVLLSPYLMHRDPRYFDKPETFLPERFAPGWEERLPRYAYFPFGGGPRVCIGNTFAMMEAQLILATVMQRYHLALLAGFQPTPQALVTLRPRDGLPMRLWARHNQIETPPNEVAFTL